jgi:hypothetical protein
MRTWPALAALVGFTFFSASAQDREAELGTLTCTAVEGEANHFATEAVVLSCLFRATNGGYSETYTGTLRRFGGSEPMEGSLVLMWRVSGEDIQLAPGMLEQSYLSAIPADEPESRELRGQKNSAITLRPLAKAAETAELSVAVLDLDLKQTGA